MAACIEKNYWFSRFRYSGLVLHEKALAVANAIVFLLLLVEFAMFDMTMRWCIAVIGLSIIPISDACLVALGSLRSLSINLRRDPNEAEHNFLTNFALFVAWLVFIVWPISLLDLNTFYAFHPAWCVSFGCSTLTYSAIKLIRMMLRLLNAATSAETCGVLKENENEFK